MGSKIVTIWTCDRCGYTDEGSDHYQPALWVAIMQTSPPKASFDNCTRRTLCGDCHDRYLDWWNAVEKDTETHSPDGQSGGDDG